METVAGLSVGTIRVFDGALYYQNNGQTFAWSEYEVATVIVHEIGHNWDGLKTASSTIYENEGVGSFRALSSWNGPSGAYTGWTYGTNAVFVSNYARTDPYEDWAETFAATLRPNSIRYNGSAPSKVTWMNGWLDGISDPS